jgi:hypothetical protein
MIFFISTHLMVKHRRFRSLSMPKKEIVSILCGSGSGLGHEKRTWKKERSTDWFQGRIQRGAHPVCAPPKIGKNRIFLRKIVIFHTKYPKIFAPPFAIGKKMIFWRKIVIFHTKYPNNVRTSLRSTQFF